MAFYHLKFRSLEDDLQNVSLDTHLGICDEKGDNASSNVPPTLFDLVRFFDFNSSWGEALRM